MVIVAASSNNLSIVANLKHCLAPEIPDIIVIGSQILDDLGTLGSESRPERRMHLDKDGTRASLFVLQKVRCSPQNSGLVPFNIHFQYVESLVSEHAVERDELNLILRGIFYHVALHALPPVESDASCPVTDGALHDSRPIAHSVQDHCLSENSRGRPIRLKRNKTPTRSDTLGECCSVEAVMSAYISYDISWTDLLHHHVPGGRLVHVG
jgi:hypothetical protein